MTDSAFWQVTLTVDCVDVEVVDTALSQSGAQAISSFELEPGPDWRVTALFDDEPSHNDFTDRLTAVLSDQAVAKLDLTIEYLAARDWVSENLKEFPPIAIAGFWIHGSHTRPPDGTLTPILIDAGPAFGSGEHATTEGCLAGIDALATTLRVQRALDMGCGSGILAIAIAKRWAEATVLGVDNDAPSVRFARQAVVTNGVAGQTTIVEGDGYNAPEVTAAGPYELIAANILMRPLIAMAPDLAHHLAPGGHAVLSGLLVNQASAVIAAHEDHNLSLAKRLDLRGWTTLIMTKESERVT